MQNWGKMVNFFRGSLWTQTPLLGKILKGTETEKTVKWTALSEELQGAS